jgi:hypothetical protein
MRRRSITLATATLLHLVDGVNDVLSPIATTRQSAETEAPQGCQFDDTFQKLFHFVGIVDGMRMNLTH